MKIDGYLWKVENDLIYSPIEQIYLVITNRGEGKSNRNFVVTYAKLTLSSVDHKSFKRYIPRSKHIKS